MLTSVGEDCNNFIAVHAHQCPLLYNRSGMTIAQHLWIMSKLLSMKEPITDNKKESKSDPAVLPSAFNSTSSPLVFRYGN